MNPLGALSGIRVVDFCWVLAGPLGTRILANFGAEVIRVESRARPDGVRQAVGPDGAPNPNLGNLFNDVNTGKRSLTVDLRSERGRELVRRLIATSDVVTNNYRPGALERMGFGYEELRALKPDIILLNMPGTHRLGPWRPRSTMGNIVMAASGFNQLTGFPGRRPRGLGVAYPDFTSPYLMATTILAALRERDRSGSGQELDLSQLSGMIALLGVEWMHYRATSVQPPRRANRDPNYCPHAPYPTRGEDEWCAIAVETDSQWAALCALMGQPQLAETPRFASHEARKAHEAGWQIGTHANGDVAIDMTMRIYERLQREQPRRDPRYRLEHCTVINDSLVKRIAALGAIPNPFSTYVYYHGEKMRHYGKERLEHMFALRSFLDAGVRITQTSDYPPGPYEPMMALQSAVTRTDMNGEVWGPSQRVTVEEAIRIGTLHGAYASYEENLKGSIETGKLADLVVLGRDPLKVDPSTLIDIPIERTMVGGRWVFES